MPQNNALRTSNMSGEINPANMSISGGLPIQNSFRLDGFEMNNDIDSAALAVQEGICSFMSAVAFHKGLILIARC